ncbi:MAG: GDYXXLXY domain-containing protein [Maricaulaceae bacterium]
MTGLRQWLVSRRLPGAALLAAGLVLFTGHTVISHERARWSGAELILDTRPVDPRDLLLGHYVEFRYAAQNIDLNALAEPPTFDLDSEDRLWVRFARDPDTGCHVPDRVSQTRPDTGVALEAVLRGRFRRSAEGPSRVIHVRYEPALPKRYYAEREAALALEGQTRAGAVAVILSVAPERAPLIRGLVVEGERLEDRIFSRAGAP